MWLDRKGHGDGVKDRSQNWLWIWSWQTSQNCFSGSTRRMWEISIVKRTKEDCDW